MSEPSTVVPSQNPAPTAPVSPEDAMSARIAKAMAAIPAKGDPAPAEAPPASADPEPAPAAAKPATELEKPTPATPAPDPKEDLRIAKAQHVAQQREREAYELKQAKATLEKDLAAAREAVEKERAARAAREAELERMTPLEILEKVKKTNYEQVTKDIVDKKYEPRSAEQLASEETRSVAEQLKAELAELKAERAAEKAAIEAERAQAAEAAQAEKLAEDIGKELKANAANFPVIATLPWAGKQIVATAKRTGRSYGEIAQEMEKAARADVDTVFSSDDTLKVFLGDEATKTRVLTLLGIKQSQSASPASDEGNGGQRKGAPAAIPQSRSTDPGTRVKVARPVTTEDRIAKGVARLEERQRSR